MCAKFIVEKAEQERQAAVIRAEGEAEAAATISHALDKAGEAFVALRKIGAAKAIVQSLSTNRNVTYVLSSGGNVYRLIRGRNTAIPYHLQAGHQACEMARHQAIWTWSTWPIVRRTRPTTGLLLSLLILRRLLRN